MGYNRLKIFALVAQYSKSSATFCVCQIASKTLENVRKSTVVKPEK